MNFGLECKWMLGGDPLEGMFANCTHIIVGLLKALKVTMVGIEYDDAAFQHHFKKVHTRNCSSKKSVYQNSASKVANWIIVDIFISLMLSLANS